jgi:hypothetical protein
MKKIIAITALLTVCGLAEAANTSMVFVNGITTTETRAKDSINSLQNRYCVNTVNDCSTVEFLYFYNTTEGFTDDTNELKIQSQIEEKAISEANYQVKIKIRSQYKENPKDYVKGSDAYNLFSAHLNAKITQLLFVEKAKNEDIHYDKSFLGTDSQNANSDIVRNLNKLVSGVKAELEKDGNTRRVVLVPHSQGNYFSQAAEAILRDKYPQDAKRLTVMGVASVSTVAQINGQHVSLLQDRALALHGLKTDFETDGNFDAGWSLGATPEKDDILQKHPDDVNNHGFLETYLGVKKIVLPVDRYMCREMFIPAERLVQERERRRKEHGVVCQKKEDINNQPILVGVGSTFPVLRGVSLHTYITQRVRKAVDFVNASWSAGKWLGYVDTLNGSGMPGEESNIQIKDGWATVKSTGYFWSVMHRILETPINGDAVKIEWRSKVSYETDGISCFDHGVNLNNALDTINSTTGKNIGSVMFDGCWYDGGFNINQARFIDDKIFIRDLKAPHIYAIETNNGKVRFYIDGVVVSQQEYLDKVGSLDRLSIYFKGSGAVDYVKVSSDGRQVLLTDF